MNRTLYKTDKETGDVKICHAEKNQIPLMLKAGWSEKKPAPTKKTTVKI